jgi:hypothetical protein
LLGEENVWELCGLSIVGGASRWKRAYCAMPCLVLGIMSNISFKILGEHLKQRTVIEAVTMI